MKAKRGGRTGRRAGRGNLSRGLGGLLAGLAAVGLLLVVPFPTGTPAGNGRASGSVQSACPTLNLTTPICHVFLVFLENRDEPFVMSHAPFERYLAHKYAFAGNFYSIEHYSFPAYTASTSGVANNYQHVMKLRNVVDLLNARSPNLTWDAFFQGMPYPCDQSAGHQYRAAHNPFVYYADIWGNQSYCQAHDVGFSKWNRDVARNQTPNYGFFSPNITNECWDSNIHVCDTFLRTWMSPLINDSFFQSSVFFVTYDEGSPGSTLGANGTTGGGHVYTAAVSPYACPGYNSTYNYTHYNLLTTTEWLLGLNGTGNPNDSWTLHPPMKDLFCFPAPWPLTFGSSALGPDGAGAPALLAVRRPGP
ncbi:MAG: alkaline phosphatase family protein [Thermoplasmata archaeon]|nr:alkaline phosphatase family protein [Thermoplasmata archaeon]